MTTAPLSRDLLLYNLGKRGYPLTGNDYGTESELLPVHQVIIDILCVPRNFRLIEGIAIIIDNDPPDYERLVRAALQTGLQNQVGYLLNGTLQVLEKHKPHQDFSDLERAVQRLRENLRPELGLLGRLDIPNEMESLARHRWPEEIEWNVAGGVPYNQLDIQYGVYQHVSPEHKGRSSRTSSIR